MSEYNYQLHICGLNWDICVPDPLMAEERCSPFLGSSEEIPYFHILFQTGAPTEMDEECVRERNPVVWRGKDYYRVVRTLAKEKDALCSIIIPDDTPTDIHGLLFPDAKGKIRKLDTLLELLEVETLLSSIGAINLHSSLIKYQDQAVLFSGPSGIGKSTQAALWEKYRQAEQINGDRSLIRKVDGKWMAYGSPFSGSSGIFRNDHAKIKTILILQQGSINSIKCIPPSSAFSYLYSQTVVPTWNKSAQIKIVETIQELVENIPIVLFECTPDQEAVEKLDSFIQEKLNDS